jgi:hypothetical protein
LALVKIFLGSSVWVVVDADSLDVRKGKIKGFLDRSVTTFRAALDNIMA